MTDQIFVIKKSGERQPFSEEKVLRSIRRVGLPESLHQEVLDHVKSRLHPDISTDEIFSHIIEFVDPKDRKASIRFNLKNSLFELGPTGFPFEQYLSRVFENMGYKASTDLIMQGECISHEIDLLIEKEGKKAIVEAKFHNQPGSKTDVHVVLYTYSRFLDVSKKNNIDDVWVVTNTRLTSDAITYALCKRIQVIGWSYPEVGNLQDLIEQPALYPITILTALSKPDKRRLIEEKIVLCQDLLKKDEATLREIMSSPQHLEKARDDAKLVCKI